MAARTFQQLVVNNEQLLTTSYVLLESFAIVQKRLGIPGVRALDAIFSIIEIVWIDSELHQSALSAVLAAAKRNLSLVDCASFEVMRRRGVRTAFVFDSDFPEHGFDTVP